MIGRIALPLTLLAMLAAAAPASATTHCRPQKHERRLAAGARYALLLRTVEDRESFSAEETLYACDRRSGARTPVGDGGWDFTSSNDITAARVVGRKVAFLQESVDDHDGVVTTSLALADAQSPGYEIVPIVLGTVSAWTLSTRGDVAWTGGGALHIWRAVGRSARLLDEGVSLDRLAFRPDGALTWRHDGSPRSAPAVPPASRCPAGAKTGTADVDAYPTSRNAEVMLALCWRATGRRTDLGPSGAIVALAGRYAALRLDNTIRRYDLSAGTMTETSALNAFDIRVDEAGDLAWRSPEGDGVTIWVADAFGTHQVGTGRWSAPFQRDGATIAWGPAAADRYQLLHGATG